MALVRSLWNEDYWADFSTFVLRDGLGDDDTDYEPVPAALDEYECVGRWGTAGRAGVGWFLAPSGDGRHRVRLEVHDAPPEPAGEQWPQVLETPYRSPTGTVGLINVTDGPALQTVELLGPGSYRLQICRLEGDDDWDWLLRCWPCTPEEPPRWLRRDPRPWHEPETFAEDLIGVPAWSPGHRLSCTIGELADRLLLTPAQTRTAVETAVRQHWLELDGDPAGGAPFELTVPGGAELEELEPPPLSPAPPASEPGPEICRPLRLPAIVEGGNVVRPGGLTEGGRYDGRMVAAVDTVQGAVVTGEGGAVLVHRERRLTENPSGPIAVGPGGILLAVTEFRPAPTVHAIDLATGERQTRPGTVIGIRGDDIYLRDGEGDLRWRPGAETERLPFTIDHIEAYSGAYAVREADGVRVVRRDGSTWTAPADARTLLPGGEGMYRLTDPLALTLWYADGRQRTRPVPPDPLRRSDRIRLSAWEDRDHFVYALDVPDLRYIGLSRLDVRDGQVGSLFMFPPIALFVQPPPH